MTVCSTAYSMQWKAAHFILQLQKKPDTSFNSASIEQTEIKTNGIINVEPIARGFVPSFYVYTNKNGYLQVNLPYADQKKYHLKFFEENGNFLFELKNIKDKALTLDKSNFLHAGWFNFELYENEKVVEKHKFYIAKDF